MAYQIKIPTKSERYHAGLWAEDNHPALVVLETALLGPITDTLGSGEQDKLVATPGDDLVHLYNGRPSGHRYTYSTGAGPFSAYFERTIGYVDVDHTIEFAWFDPCEEVCRAIIGELPEYVIAVLAYDVRAGFCAPLSDIPEVASDSSYGQIGRRLRARALEHINGS